MCEFDCCYKHTEMTPDLFVGCQKAYQTYRVKHMLRSHRHSPAHPAAAQAAKLSAPMPAPIVAVVDYAIGFLKLTYSHVMTVAWCLPETP